LSTMTPMMGTLTLSSQSITHCTTSVFPVYWDSFQIVVEACVLPYQHDTYDRRIQLGALRRRREDAEALYNASRWAGAIYLAG